MVFRLFFGNSSKDSHFSKFSNSFEKLAIDSPRNYWDFQPFQFPGDFFQDSIKKMPEIPSIYLDSRKIEEIIGNPWNFSE
jgi:hypothetical protein